jgi:CheY-specific phosphatase CheX
MATVGNGFELTERRLLEALLRSAKYVFETNLVRQAELVQSFAMDAFADAVRRGEKSGEIISVITLSGDRRVTLTLVTPMDLNHLVARDILNYDEFQLKFGAGGAIYRDAAGELANMVAGSFKGILSRSKIDLKLEPPKTLRDAETLLTVLQSAKQRTMLGFRLEEFSLKVCLWL